MGNSADAKQRALALREAAGPILRMRAAPNVSGVYLYDSPDGEVELTYAQRDEVFMRYATELSKAARDVRLVITNGLGWHEVLTDLRREHPVTSRVSALLDWEFFPDREIWDPPSAKVAKAEAALSHDLLSAAADNLAEAADLAAAATDRYRAYRDGAEEGASRAVAGLEVVRDVSAAAVSAYNPLAGMAYSAAQQLAEEGTAVAIGIKDRIDWGSIAFNAAFSFLLSKGGRALKDALAKSLLRSPAVQRIVSRYGQKAVSQVVARVVKDAVEGRVDTILSNTASMLFERARGNGEELTFDAWITMVADELVNTQGYLTDIVSAAVERKVEKAKKREAGEKSPRSAPEPPPSTPATSESAARAPEAPAEASALPAEPPAPAPTTEATRQSIAENASSPDAVGMADSTPSTITEIAPIRESVAAGGAAATDGAPSKATDIAPAAAVEAAREASSEAAAASSEQGQTSASHATQPRTPGSKPKRPKGSSAAPESARVEERASPTRAKRASGSSFINASRRTIIAAIETHPLRRLLVLTVTKEGKEKWDWYKTVLVDDAGKPKLDAKGRLRRGRYAILQGAGWEKQEHEGPVVQAGHPEAYASGAPQRFMLEDADANYSGGVTIEGRGAFSMKAPVDVEGVPVELGTLMSWERQGVVDAGTVERALDATPGMERTSSPSE